MKTLEIKSDDTTLAIRAAWTKRWVDGNTKPLRGSIRLKNGTFTFADAHGQTIVTLGIEDIAAVHGHFVIVPGLRGGVVGTGIFESGIRIVPKEKQKDLLYFSWDPGKYASNRGRKYREWLKAFKALGVPTRNNSYWLNSLVVLFICAMLLIGLHLAHLL
ncbi:MAG: hypothetical protein QG649_463 [Patescibacteria group bacterium]|nr:hypothetical protein [Patescibacteria group bacterium]